MLYWLFHFPFLRIILEPIRLAKDMVGIASDSLEVDYMTEWNGKLQFLYGQRYSTLEKVQIVDSEHAL